MSFVDWTPNRFAMDLLDTILATHNQLDFQGNQQKP
jgi:hypothetical protein